MDVIICSLLLPFLGTAAGAAGVYFWALGSRKEWTALLSGFAAGVMTAASIWSLILPALESAERLGRWQFLPGLVGVWGGFAFLMGVERVLPQQSRSEHTMLNFAVTLHNLPEGMAVGVAAAGYALAPDALSGGELLSLALGIAIQNIPEGAIISMPMGSLGLSKGSAFRAGTLSGAVEPLGALVALGLSWLVVPVLPYLLCFAAGAMLHVVVAELVPQMLDTGKSQRGIWAYCAGFTVMMVLDVALG